MNTAVNNVGLSYIHPDYFLAVTEEVTDSKLIFICLLCQLLTYPSISGFEIVFTTHTRTHTHTHTHTLTLTLETSKCCGGELPDSGSGK